ncbi:hypothetical protein [Paenibacillus sp. KN14-4R]|uniref:hypothetical protein n=1 Tax=Paenibacillus sp. KN14-4R TaxID=3445773 RepID=UPI003F9FC796
MNQISNYLFIGSSALLLITILIKGGFTAGVSKVFYNVEQKMQQDRLEELEKKDHILSGIYRSIAFWISIAGMILSILIPKL